MAGNWQERIEQKAEVLGGKPVVKGSGMSVEFPLGLMAAGWEQAEEERVRVAPLG